MLLLVHSLNLQAALQAGDMNAAARNIDRGGPNAARIAEERRMILAGPKDLTQVKATAPTTPKIQTVQQQPNALQRFANWVSQPFTRRQTGGIVGGKGSSITSRFSQANTQHNASSPLVVRPVVVVKRRATPQSPPVTAFLAPEVVVAV